MLSNSFLVNRKLFPKQMDVVQYVLSREKRIFYILNSKPDLTHAQAKCRRVTRPKRCKYHH